MTNLKFFNPPIDEAGMMAAYDRPVLEQFQERLGISDAWVTYSWGFSDQTEAEDYEFLRRSLPNFRQLGIKTHAYVQGLNVVTADHEGDLLCRDPHGRPIPYHRARHLTCPLNPAARALLLRRVEAACREDTDGVFIDNFFYGKFPLPALRRTPFFGCACQFCREAFWKHTGAPPPTWMKIEDVATREYISFRCRVMAELSADIGALCRRYGKLYGCNGLDLDLNPRFFYGYEVRDLLPNQDYVLVENFNHPSRGRSNSHLSTLIASAKIPVGIVSYVNPIGRHQDLTQADLDAVYSDAKRVGYLPIYKGSEFSTGGQWHVLKPTNFSAPTLLPPVTRSRRPLARRTMLGAAIRLAAGRFQSELQWLLYHSPHARWALGWLIDDAMQRAGLVMASSDRAWLRVSPSA